jgi:alpha-tubulin suppressor-like RCC1 family protein
MKLRHLYLWGVIGAITFLAFPAAAAPHKSEIAAGDYHTLAIQKNGSLWAWGANNYGQLGLGSAEANAHPIPTLVGTGWVTVAAGGFHSLGLKADGSLWTWGANNNGQLGLRDTADRLSPMRVPRFNPPGMIPALEMLLD